MPGIGLRVVFAVLFAAVAACSSQSFRTRDTLYDQLGGKPGVAALIDASLDRYANDPRVAPSFAHTDITRFRRMFAMYVCQVADGPCHYTGASMAEVHRGMNLSETQFNAVVEDLTDAMTSLRIPVPVQNRLIKRLARVRADVIYK